MFVNPNNYFFNLESLIAWESMCSIGSWVQSIKSGMDSIPS